MKKLFKNVCVAAFLFAGLVVAGCAVSAGEASSSQEGALAMAMRCPNTQPPNVDPCTGKDVGDACTMPDGSMGKCQKYVPDEPLDWCLCAAPPPAAPPGSALAE
jgi:hypothetical protein